MFPLKRIVIGFLLILIFFTVPVSAGGSGSDSFKISATSESVMQASPFSIFISGSPDTLYYVWVKGTRNMSGNRTDSPPVICTACDYSSGVFKDRVTGPFRIGMHEIYEGNGSTILEDIPSFTHYNNPTDYYARVLTDEKGKGGITFETYSAKPGNYTLRVENGADVKEVGILVEEVSRSPIHSHIKELGTIRYVSIEGGFYGFYPDSGGHYDPNNLPENFQVDGMRVMIEAITHEDQITYHMWGTPIEITRIEDYSDPVGSPSPEVTLNISPTKSMPTLSSIPDNQSVNWPASCETFKMNGSGDEPFSSRGETVTFLNWLKGLFGSFFPKQ